MKDEKQQNKTIKATQNIIYINKYETLRGSDLKS